MKIPRFALLAVTCIFMASVAPTEVIAADADQAAAITEAETAGAKFDWDKQNKRLGLLSQLRGLATVILLVSLIGSAMYVGITGKSGPALFTAVGAVVLYGGFWVVLLVFQAFGAQPTGTPTTFVNPAATSLVVAPIIKDFTDYLIGMLTTAIMPFILIYGFWMALGVASGETQNAGVQIKNYVLGGTVAIGASLLVQIFTI